MTQRTRAFAWRARANSGDLALATAVGGGVALEVCPRLLACTLNLRGVLGKLATHECTQADRHR